MFECIHFSSVSHNLERKFQHEFPQSHFLLRPHELKNTKSQPNDHYLTYNQTKCIVIVYFYFHSNQRTYFNQFPILVILK